MPQLGLGLRANVSGASIYDADAVSYFARAGVTDATAKAQINAFVKGAKDLGIYNNMICWPMRSTQNIGSGNTVYSLGGKQISNATKVGGTWGTDGIFFSGSTQYMTSDVANIPKDLTTFISAKGNGSTYANFPVIGGVYDPAGASTGQLALSQNDVHANATNFQIAGPAIYAFTPQLANGLSGSSSFVALSGSYKQGSVFNARNVGASSVVTQASFPTETSLTLTKMCLNGRYDAGIVALGNPMTSSFYAFITPNCDSIISSFYTLYKTTLGTGLGLP
jgi:hypothetical protein